MPQVIARHVFTMRGEFDREPHERTGVQAMQEAFDHRLSDQLQILRRAEQRGGGQLRMAEGHSWS